MNLLPSLAAAALMLAASWQVRAQSPAAQDRPPAAQIVAPGVWLIPGGFPPKREPDGATVVFAAPRGLVVLDTGRHAWHRQAIQDLARKRRSPIVAIINSHWHLDHTSGNAALKRAYPGARVFASRAVEGALKDFLPKSAKDTRDYLASGDVDPATAEDLRGDLAVIADPAALIPDVPIDRTQTLSIGGRRLEVHLAKDAATAGDVWLYDPATRTAAVGDLVTLPAAFLDTACPAGWSAALGEIWKTPFRRAIPGHGPVLTRRQFAAYRAAFDALIDCAASARGKSECAAAWTQGVHDLLDPGELALKRSSQMTGSYIDLLRAHGGKSPFCEEKA
jgi:glyoxylase-like metal-dependent hydrolase (beta-lactamase superfamily II)